MVKETDQPEENNKEDEKYWIDHPQECLTDLPTNLSVQFLGPDFPGRNLVTSVLCDRLPVGLHQDVHEGFEETEDQPAVDHLDVSRWGQIGTDTDVMNIYQIKISTFKYFP